MTFSSGTNRRATGIATTLALLAVFGVAPAAAQSTPTPNAPTCQGQTATIIGTPGDDTIRGTSGDDVIVSLDGNDTIRSRGGNDIICAGPGADTVTGGSGNDTIFGGRGNDELDGGRNADTIEGGNGNDTVLGGWGNDTLAGNDGDDTIRGSRGKDRISGNDGRDTLRGGNGDDTLLGGAKADTLRGGNGDDNLRGNNGDDQLWPDAGAGTNVGGSGIDFIDGTIDPIDLDTDEDGVPDTHDEFPLDPNRSFTGGQFVPIISTISGRVAVWIDALDANDDGIDDLIVVEDRTGTAIQLGDGTGNFTPSKQGFFTEAEGGVASLDANGDGYDDVVISQNPFRFRNNNVPPSELWLNDGNGTFVLSDQSIGTRGSFDLTTFDADGDGDTDIAESYPGNRIWLNDGNGNFTEGPQFTDERLFGIDAVDVDGDGDGDLVATSNALTSEPRDATVVYLNDGQGNFVDSGQVLPGDANGIEAIDIDGDGDNDLVTGNYFHILDVWANDGNGTFSFDPGAIDAQFAFDITVLDVNGDYRPDLMLGLTGQVWINTPLDAQ